MLFQQKDSKYLIQKGLEIILMKQKLKNLQHMNPKPILEA